MCILPKAKFRKRYFAVNDQANGLYLCSNYHNKIHYGRIEDVKEMKNVALKDKGIINLKKK